jgi:atypical dual specificity phosphatase
VDLDELKVRLEHMLQRLRVLQRAAASARPARAAPGVFVSGAVGAASRHVLRHLGVTHVLNATADLLMLDADDGFETMRVPLRDEVEEELGPHLAAACAFIDAGLAAGGAVLVHCHQGASRSCSLVLAWTMARQRLPLARALELMRAAHPPAAPNRGYMAALGALEEELFGETTVPPDRVRRTKPEPRACPECGAVVGLSAESVAVHMRLKHAPAARGLSSPRAPEALGERG